MPHSTLRIHQIEEGLEHRDQEEATKEALKTPRGYLWQPGQQVQSHGFEPEGTFSSGPDEDPTMQAWRTVV
ncbi:MAG: hypothetical protein RL150_90 [Candidatus Parcubacteria bacterium]|jgi:hypothetical protein